MSEKPFLGGVTKLLELFCPLGDKSHVQHVVSEHGCVSGNFAARGAADDRIGRNVEVATLEVPQSVVDGANGDHRVALSTVYC